MSNTMRYLITGVISVVTFALIVSGASDIPETLRTLVVPDEYKSISEAVTKAQPGDTVFVKEGIYNEQVHLTKDIKLIGAGRDKVTIRYKIHPDHVIFADRTSGLIKDLTVEQIHEGKPNEKAVCIFILDSSVEVVRCRVRNSAGVGIIVKDKSSPVVRDCIVESNGHSGIGVFGKGAAPIQWKIWYLFLRWGRRQGRRQHLRRK